MRLRLTFILLAAIAQLNVFAQQDPEVGTPQVSYYNDTLKIVYNLSECKEEAIINISLNLFYSNGSKINASRLSGDIGSGVVCGSNRVIYWDLAADNIQLDDEIEIEIIARGVIPDKPAIAKSKETRMASGRGKIVASSLILPGLGQKKARGKSAPLILGVAGYGSAALAGIMYSESNRAYNRYLESETQQERDDNFKKSEELHNMATMALIGAAGVWTVNLIWAAVVPIDMPEELAVGIAPVAGRGIGVSARWNF